MSKMDDAQAKAKKILEDLGATGGSHTEVDVETTSEQTVAGGSVPADATNAATSQAADPADDQAAELTADLQRLQAEFANYKRRAEAERADVIDFAKTRVIREFLAVRDSFDAELAHRPAATDPTWAASIDAIRGQFDKVLASLGVERFESVGQPFDPHFHEAIATDGAGDTVTEELQAGYKLGATILRHAMVKVGQANGPLAAGPAPVPAEPVADNPAPDMSEPDAAGSAPE